MDSGKKKRDNQERIAAFILAWVSLGVWAAAAVMPEAGYRFFYLQIGAAIGYMILLTVNLVRNHRSGASQQDAVSSEDRLWSVYAISGGIANAYVTVIWVWLAFGSIAHAGSFFGDLQWGGIIGDVAALAFIVLSMHFYYQQCRRRTLLAMMLTGLAVPVAPLIIVLAKRPPGADYSRKQYALAFVAVFTLFVGYALVDWYIEHNSPSTQASGSALRTG